MIILHRYIKQDYGYQEKRKAQQLVINPSFIGMMSPNYEDYTSGGSHSTVLTFLDGTKVMVQEMIDEITELIIESQKVSVGDGMAQFENLDLR